MRSQRASRLPLGMLGLALLAGAALAVAWVWQRTIDRTGASLISVGQPSLSTGPCPSPAAIASAGPSATIVTDWEIQADPVAVLNNFTRRNWRAVSVTTLNMSVLPNQATVIPVGVGQIYVYQGVTLASTERRTTRLVSSISLVLCSG